MKYTYKLKECSEHDFLGRSVKTWSIEVVSEHGECVKRVDSVFCEKSKGEKFINLCNISELDPIHLFDVIEDTLG